MADSIVFTGQDGEKKELYVVEQTTISGCNYLLVAESEDEESVAYIMRESGSGQDELGYEIVEDEEELKALSKVFEELLDDVDVEI